MAGNKMWAIGYQRQKPRQHRVSDDVAVGVPKHQYALRAADDRTKVARRQILDPRIESARTRRHSRLAQGAIAMPSMPYS